MTFDPRTEANIATLTPATQVKARAFLQAIQESNRLEPGWAVKIISALRSYAEQEVLYEQGRTTPGHIVTDAPPGYSNHNFGIAFDLGIFNAQGQYIDDLADSGKMTQKEISSYYRLFPAIARPMGLEWGGDWVSLDDEPHYEMNPWPDMTEQDKLARLRAMKAAGEAIA